MNAANVTMDMGNKMELACNVVLKTVIIAISLIFVQSANLDTIYQMENA